MAKIIYVVGIGGRTGVMFGHELSKGADIVGIGLEREVRMVNEGKIKLQRGGMVEEAFLAKAVESKDFSKVVEEKYPDFILLAVRNPINEAVKFYYSLLKSKSKLPGLMIAQNGLSVIDDAKAALKEVMGQDADKVRIIRMSLANGIDGKMDGDNFIINYKLPIKLGFGVFGGQADDVREIFSASGFKFQEFEGGEILKMENSKLFTNLIGMATAVEGMTVSEGYESKEVYKKEVAMLKEYVQAVRAAGSGFVFNWAGYPIAFLAGLMMMPKVLLEPLRGLFRKIIVKGRNRPKDLFEIDYYNGEVVKLGKKYGVPTPVNEEIVRKAKEMLKNHS